MHHALEIQEILFNIFGHYYLPRASKEAADLASLARTCRAFKEPALDVLWEGLHDLSILAQCLPEASQLPPHQYCYSFRRPLTQVEWGILISYTHRTRSVSTRAFSGLDKESLEILSKPPTMESLFPNLRHLSFDYPPDAKALMLLPLPSLISLDVELYDACLLEDFLKSFAKTSPNLTRLFIHAYHYAGVDMNTIDSSFIRQWQNLEFIICPEIFLDAITLLHLSRLPGLTRLSFTLRSTFKPDWISPSDSPLIFSNLHQLALDSEYLDPISRLLSQTRLPTVTDFFASIKGRQDLSSFLANVQGSGIGHAIQELCLDQGHTGGRKCVPEDRPVLGFQDVQPFKAFINLHCLNLNIERKVDLADSELLTLASAWPRLERHTINEEWGWNTLGGITPNGLLQLLQTCLSLNHISLAIDTRGYTEIPPSPASLGLTLPHMFSIDVLDSFIEEESVPAITAFFAGVVPRFIFLFHAWRGLGMWLTPNRNVCKARWEHVCERVEDIVSQDSVPSTPPHHSAATIREAISMRLKIYH